MSWVILLFAGLLEVGWAVGLKQSAGFTRLWPSVLTVLAMLASIGLLGLALRHLPLAGTASEVASSANDFIERVERCLGNGVG